MPLRRRVPFLHRARAGFTLFELMIVLAVVAVLAGIAVPAFLEQAARARRTDVQVALLEDAGYMQRYYAAHDSYRGSPAPQLSAPRSPRTGPTNYVVTLSVPADDPGSFLLVATRSGAMRADACGDFTYDNLGRRDLVAGTFAAGRSAPSCWR